MQSTNRNLAAYTDPNAPNISICSVHFYDAQRYQNPKRLKENKPGLCWRQMLQEIDPSTSRIGDRTTNRARTLDE